MKNFIIFFSALLLFFFLYQLFQFSFGGDALMYYGAYHVFFNGGNPDDPV